MKKQIAKALKPVSWATTVSLCAAFCITPALADAISPGVNDIGKVYSTEKPNYGYFGTGPSGRLAEASHLRFMADRDLSDGKLDEAMTTLAKAVQLDPSDPQGHLMLARAMTRKIKMNKSNIDWELYGQCLDEWSLIAQHDADHEEQMEARMNMSSLKKLAKTQVATKKGKKEKKSFLAGLNPLNRFK